MAELSSNTVRVSKMSEDEQVLVKAGWMDADGAITSSGKENLVYLLFGDKLKELADIARKAQGRTVDEATE